MYKVKKQGIVHIARNNTTTLCGQRGGFQYVFDAPVDCHVCAVKFAECVHQYAQGSEFEKYPQGDGDEQK